MIKKRNNVFQTGQLTSDHHRTSRLELSVCPGHHTLDLSGIGLLDLLDGQLDRLTLMLQLGVEAGEQLLVVQIPPDCRVLQIWGEESGV